MSGAPHTSLWARDMLAAVWDASKWGNRADREAGILAIARLETGFAKWTAGGCVDSNNWGSIHSPPGSTEGCEATDSHADGKRYRQLFRTWPTPEEGLIAFVSLLRARARTWEALASRSATALAVAMRKDLYYVGFGATEAARITGYETALFTASAATARQLGVPALALTRVAGSTTSGAVLVVGALAGVVACVWWERRRRHP